MDKISLNFNQNNNCQRPSRRRSLIVTGIALSAIAFIGYQQLSRKTISAPATIGLNTKPRTDIIKKAQRGRESSRNKDQPSLRTTLQNIEINQQKWTAKPACTAEGKFIGHQDIGLIKFFLFLKNHQNASDADIQGKLNETTQNCATNTILGLCKIGAVTKRGNSPKQETRISIKRNTHLAKAFGLTLLMDLSKILGIDEIDRTLNTLPDTIIPKGTVVFFSNTRNKKPKNSPFQHVFFAEKTGKNSERIYRSLNQGQHSSQLQSFEEVRMQGGYILRSLRVTFSKKYNGRNSHFIL